MVNEQLRGAVSEEDRGFLYGDGLFETVRVEDGQAPLLERHRERFLNSCHALGFCERQAVDGVKVLESLPGREDGLWRVTVTRQDPEAFGGGVGSIRLRHRPLRDSRSLRATVVEGLYSPQMWLAEHKTTSWLRCVEARRRASLRGFDEAIMASSSGRLGEASAANLFLLIDGQWVTPVVEGILPGVVRAALIEGGRDAGIELVEREVVAADLLMAESVAVTSSGLLVTAVEEVDGQVMDTEAVEELRNALDAYLKRQ